MTRFIRLAALAALLFPLAALAQSADRSERRLTHLTERLDLTDAQVAIVRNAMTEGRERDRTRRGDSWTLAAQLAPTMSAAQLDAIRDGFAERAEARRQRGEQRSERRAEREGDRHSARDEALGLSDAQKQALAAQRSERQENRADVPAEIAEILTDDQEAILLVHRALSSQRGARGHRGGSRGARRGGPRR